MNDALDSHEDSSSVQSLFSGLSCSNLDLELSDSCSSKTVLLLNIRFVYRDLETCSSPAAILISF